MFISIPLVLEVVKLVSLCLVLRYFLIEKVGKSVSISSIKNCALFRVCPFPKLT